MTSATDDPPPDSTWATTTPIGKLTRHHRDDPIPFGRALTAEERALYRVRLTAYAAHTRGVPLTDTIAEVHRAYGHTP